MNRLNPNNDDTYKLLRNNKRGMINMEIEGIIDRISSKDGRFGVKLTSDDRWFNGFGALSVTKGDRVLITYEENKSGDRTFYNTKPEHVVKTGESMAKKSGKLGADGLGAFVSADKLTNNRDGLIIRQVSFKGAIEIVKSLIETGIKTEELFTKEGTIEAVKEYTNAFERIILNMDEDDTSKG